MSALAGVAVPEAGVGGQDLSAVLDDPSVITEKSGNIFRVGIFLRFRLAHHTYDAPAWGCIVRAESQTKSN